MVKSWKLSVYDEEKDKNDHSSTFFNLVLEILAKAIRQEK